MMTRPRAAEGEVLLYDPRRLETPMGRLPCSASGEPVTSLAWQSDRSHKSHSAGRSGASKAATAGGRDAGASASGRHARVGSLSPIPDSPNLSPRVSLPMHVAAQMGLQILQLQKRRAAMLDSSCTCQAEEMHGAQAAEAQARAHGEHSSQQPMHRSVSFDRGRQGSRQQQQLQQQQQPPSPLSSASGGTSSQGPHRTLSANGALRCIVCVGVCARSAPGLPSQLCQTGLAQVFDVLCPPYCTRPCWLALPGAS